MLFESHFQQVGGCLSISKGSRLTPALRDEADSVFEGNHLDAKESVNKTNAHLETLPWTLKKVSFDDESKQNEAIPLSE
ncbi:hypothetical protein Tco_1131991 [Tanacetum coccineum]|uniref:Uncharacterized protein n=1 Tax=Tanacetum coccineum TaxID=301880 RepID=A0ABQ5JC22_9ASTR